MESAAYMGEYRNGLLSKTAGKMRFLKSAIACLSAAASPRTFSREERAEQNLLAEKILDDLKTGDSVAVNGICLTVTACLEDGFTADVMHETLNRSALIQLSLGQHVNLERAMPANGRFGGHIVAGHVDGTGKITEIRRDDNAVWYTIQASPQIMKYIVTKGSVTVDGISLTVAKVSETDFSISAIPHTVKITVLGERKEGDIVNLETDIIGKYVEKLITPVKEQPIKSNITRDFLNKYGF